MFSHNSGKMHSQSFTRSRNILSDIDSRPDHDKYFDVIQSAPLATVKTKIVKLSEFNQKFAILTVASLKLALDKLVELGKIVSYKLILDLSPNLLVVQYP